jgi:cholest-4-en-3-one 26-monooxygenase
MSMTRPGSLAGIDLTDHDRYAVAVPYGDFDLLRRADPVHWHPERAGRGFWAVTRYEDVLAVSRDTAAYSSETGASALEDLAPDAIEARKSMIDMDPAPSHPAAAAAGRQLHAAPGGPL